MAKAAKRRRAAPENRQKTAPISVRVHPDLKKRLDASAAVHCDGNLSREVERLLGAAIDTQTASDGFIQQTALLMGQAAVSVVTTVAADDEERAKTWRNDPWAYDAFRSAVIHLLDQTAPKESPEGKAPKALANTANESSEVFGKTVGMLVWSRSHAERNKALVAALLGHTSGMFSKPFGGES